MNVYDFDRTIYDGDSTVDFFRYCLKHRPKTLLSLPRSIFFGAGYVLGICPKLQFKRHFYRFLRLMDDGAEMVEQFWDNNQKLIKPWYLEQKKEDDIIISASPEFLLRPICGRLGVTVIASVVDIRTGFCGSANCDSGEKVRRLHEQFPDAHVESFYSDSHIDDPLAAIAEHAYLVRGNELSDWEI